MKSEVSASREPDPLVFVVGCPRSGTSLLAVLLDRHPLLAVPPETNFFGEIASRPWRTRSELARMLETWSRLPELGVSANEVMEQCPGLPRPPDVLSAILKRYRMRLSKPFSGEKTPQHIFRVRQLFKEFPTARILCMQREGFSNVMSLLAMPWWRRDFDETVRYWRDAQQLAEELKSLEPTRFMAVDLLDLARKPSKQLESIMGFLGLAFDPEQLDTATPTHAVLRRSWAWKGASTGKPDPVLTNRRLTEASPDLRARFDAALRRVNAMIEPLTQ